MEMLLDHLVTAMRKTMWCWTHQNSHLIGLPGSVEQLCWVWWFGCVSRWKANWTYWWSRGPPSLTPFLQGITIPWSKRIRVEGITMAVLVRRDKVFACCPEQKWWHMEGRAKTDLVHSVWMWFNFGRDNTSWLAGFVSQPWPKKNLQS